MIAGALVLALLVGREVVRSPAASKAMSRMLPPAVAALAVIAAIRVVDLVVGGA